MGLYGSPFRWKMFPYRASLTAIFRSERRSVMDCPRCGKPIGGYVTAGSIQSARVAKGCCPHCGSSMPRGYKVGYASSFEPKTQKYDTSAIRILRRKSWIKGLFTFLNGIVCGFFSALEEVSWVVLRSQRFSELPLFWSTLCGPR